MKPSRKYAMFYVQSGKHPVETSEDRRHPVQQQESQPEEASRKHDLSSMSRKLPVESSGHRRHPPLQQQESQHVEASRKHDLSSMSRKHPVESSGNRCHPPHSSKGKSPMADSEVERPTEQNSNSAVATVPLQKPVSEKGKSPMTNNTEAVDDKETHVVLLKKFFDLIRQTEDGVLHLDEAMDALQVKKTRINAVTRRLEDHGFIEKISNNRIQWMAACLLRSREEKEKVSSLQEEIATLEAEESTLEERIREMKEKLIKLHEHENNKKLLYFAEEDCKKLPGFQNEILIVVQAPRDTRIQKRSSTLLLQSDKGRIDLYLISPRKDIVVSRKPAGEARPSIPEPSRAIETASESQPREEIRERMGEAGASSQQDLWTEIFTADCNAGTYYLHPDTDLSIEANADFWQKSTADFDFLNDVQWDTLMDTITPPAHPVMSSVSDTIYSHTSAPQGQTLPPISSAAPSIFNMIADIDRNMEMTDKDNAIPSIRTPQAHTPLIHTVIPSLHNMITDIGGGSMKMMHDDNATPRISTTQAQTQTPVDWDSLEMTYEDNVFASIVATQDQTPPHINTMPYVPNTLLDMFQDSMEMRHENNFMANIRASQFQSPPPANTAMPFKSTMIAGTGLDGLNLIHEDNTMTSATAMSSESKTRGGEIESVPRRMEEVSPNSEIAEVSPVAHERAPIIKVYKRRVKAQVKRETVGETASRDKE